MLDNQKHSPGYLKYMAEYEAKYEPLNFHYLISLIKEAVKNNESGNFNGAIGFIWGIGIFLFAGFFIGFYKVYRFLVFCDLVDEPTGIFKNICFLTGVIGGYLTFLKAKNMLRIRKMSKNMTAVFLIAHFLMVNSVTIALLTVVNSWDFSITPKITYEFIIDKKKTISTGPKGRKHEHHYLLLKSVINSNNMSSRDVRVHKSVYDDAEFGDDYCTNTRPGLLGCEYYYKSPYVIHNKLMSQYQHLETVQGSEESNLVTEKQQVLSEIKALRDKKNKNPEIKIKSDLEELQAKIDEISKRQQELQFDLYRSMHK